MKMILHLHLLTNNHGATLSEGLANPIICFSNSCGTDLSCAASCINIPASDFGSQALALWLNTLFFLTCDTRHKKGEHIRNISFYTARFRKKFVPISEYLRRSSHRGLCGFRFDAKPPLKNNSAMMLKTGSHHSEGIDLELRYFQSHLLCRMFPGISDH